MSTSIRLHLGSVGKLVCYSYGPGADNESIVLLECVSWFTYVAIDNSCRWDYNHYVKIV